MTLTWPALAQAIRRLYPTLNYDHRPFLVEGDTAYRDKRSETFRLHYACFKYAVASVLQPRTICEIGVGSGIAARAFLSACPLARYLGVDNLHDEKLQGVPFLARLEADLQAWCCSYSFHIVQDSFQMEKLPAPGRFDLVHVDGCHFLTHAYHDTLLALRSGSRFILIDDARDTQVALGVMKALFNVRPGDVEWAFFEETWAGNILIDLEATRERRHEPAGY